MVRDHVPELVGREFPVGLGLPDELRQRHRAAQALVDAGAAGQQGVPGRAAVGPALPGDLAAGRSAGPARTRSRRAPLGHIRAAKAASCGDQKLVPDADRDVGDLIALGGRIGDRATDAVFFGHDPSARWLARSQS
mgnify:CR=1 FL=1